MGIQPPPQTIRAVLISAAILFFILLTSGCLSEPYEGNSYENQSPQVWLSSAPPEGETSRYMVHLYWGGWDPDGEVHYFEYAITDNDSGFFNPADTTGHDKWHRVFSNDSTFIFTADLLADSSDVNPPLGPRIFIRSHTFLIRAVDQAGLASKNPAYRSFTARTLSPEIDVRIPVYNGLTPALLPPVTKFTWEAKDYVDDIRTSQDPDSVRWILVSISEFNNDYREALKYIRRHPNASEWSDWHYYRAHGDSGKFWVTPPLDFGAYMFAVQAMDEAGAVTPVFDETRNVRRLIISRRKTGPLLTVRNQYIGTLKTSVELSSLSIINFPAEVPLEFSWSATAESYGGIVVGYRYGWDILDLAKDQQWAVDWTPFVTINAESPPEVYFYGSHTFHVEVLDNSGYKSRIGVKINIVPFTMEKNLLLVDDYYENPISSGLGSTNGGVPNDEEHDEFWKSALRNVEDFNPVHDIVSVSRDFPLDITKLAQYRSVIWDAYSNYAMPEDLMPFLHSLIQYIPENPDQTIIGTIQPNLIALFLAAGGHVLICGEQPMTSALNQQYTENIKYPLIFQYELQGDFDGNYGNQIDDPVGDRSFPYQEMCLDALDIAYTGYGMMRWANENGCGVTHIRVVSPAQDGLRRCLPLDPQFPLLNLRPECGDPLKFYSESSRGLNSELYNPSYFVCGVLDLGPRGCFEPIYGQGCRNQNSVVYNEPVAVWTSAFAHVRPDVPGGVAARSALWGFEPFFMDTTAVRSALEVILIDEWRLPRK